jgi:hypothetical protein
MRQIFRLEGMMKDEAFGFSGDCHDPGLAGPSGLPFPLASVISAEAKIQVRIFYSDGSPPPTAGMTEGTRWIPAYHCGDDRKRVGYDGGQRG